MLCWCKITADFVGSWRCPSQMKVLWHSRNSHSSHVIFLVFPFFLCLVFRWPLLNTELTRLQTNRRRRTTSRPRPTRKSPPVPGSRPRTRKARRRPPSTAARSTRTSRAPTRPRLNRITRTSPPRRTQRPPTRPQTGRRRVALPRPSSKMVMIIARVFLTTVVLVVGLLAVRVPPANRSKIYPQVGGWASSSRRRSLCLTVAHFARVSHFSS